MFLRRLFIGISFIIIFLPSFLEAQQSGTDSTITWSINVEDIIVTAQYAPTDVNGTVHDVTVIQSRDLQKQGFTTLAEALKQEMNIQVTIDPILGNGLSMQGIGGQNIQIMIDGVPVIGRVGSDIDLSQIDLASIARIEMINGAMSAQYGSNAAGGVINLITKKHQINNLHAELSAQTESIGINSVRAAVGYRAGAWQLDGSARWYDAYFAATDSLRKWSVDEETNLSSRDIPWNPKEQLGYRVNLRFRPHDSTAITYGYRHFYETVDIPGELRRPFFKPYAIDQQYATLRQDHSLDVKQWLGNKLYLQATAAYNTFERQKDIVRLNFDDDSSIRQENELDTANYSAWLFRGALSSQFSGTLNGQVGVEYLQEDGAGKRIPTEEPLQNAAAWLSMRFTPIEQLTVEGILRGGYNSSYDHPLVPAAHVLWQPHPRWQWRASYATGFRSPSIKELYFQFIDANHYIIGNTELAAEHSRNISLQSTYQVPMADDKTLNVEAKVFSNRIEDRITLTEIGELKYSYDNIDEYTTHGFKLGVKLRLSDHLSMRTQFGLTSLPNQLADLMEGKKDKFIELPEMQNQLQFLLPVIKTDLLLTHRFFGRQDRYVRQDDGSIYRGFSEPYHLINLNLSRSFWQNRIRLALGVRNLFDRSEIMVTGRSGGSAHGSNGLTRLVDYGRNGFARLTIALD